MREPPPNQDPAGELSDALDAAFRSIRRDTELVLGDAGLTEKASTDCPTARSSNRC